ncbi:Nuclear polyadenylated RNA-binding protein 3 [Candida viswanathii]|uniref:Nuclear polyadenylated RNA-binding protein 3 n=1 Tax=Candida viswanathii TaxID=5486 RepID=A0A367XYT0_9ASCO|nr:Nuclear polyadenylated RNA-binding protein 3 [Candida viswanathii]
MEVNPIQLHSTEEVETLAVNTSEEDNQQETAQEVNHENAAPADNQEEEEYEPGAEQEQDADDDDNDADNEVTPEVKTTKPKLSVKFNDEPEVLEPRHADVEPELYADNSEAAASPTADDDDDSKEADDYDPESAFSDNDAATDSKEEQDEPKQEEDDDDNYDPEQQDDDDENDKKEEEHAAPSSSTLPKAPLFAGLPPKPPVNATAQPSTSIITEDDDNTKQLLKDALEAYESSSMSKDSEFLELEAAEQVDKIKEFLILQGIDLEAGPNPINFDQVYSYNKPFKNLKDPIPLVPQGEYCRRPNITAPMNEEEEKEFQEFIERENFYLNLQNWDEFPDKLRLFVGNLPANTISKQDLFRIFSQYGEVIQIAIKAGYGFTQFRTSEACLDCIQGETDVPLHNKILRLDASRPQKSRRPGQPEVNNPNMSSRGRERGGEEEEAGPAHKKRKGSFDCQVYITGKSSVFFVRKVKKAFAASQISIDVEDVTQRNVTDVLSEAAYSGVLAACVVKELKVDVQTFEEAPDGGIKFDEYADVEPEEAASIIAKAKLNKYGSNMPPYVPQDTSFNERPSEPYGFQARGGRGGGGGGSKRGGHKGRGGGRGGHGHGHGHGYGGGRGGRGGGRGGFRGNDFGYGGPGGGGAGAAAVNSYGSWNHSPPQQPYGLVNSPPQQQQPYGQQFYGQPPQQQQPYGSPPQQSQFQWNSPPQQQQAPNPADLQRMLLTLRPDQVQSMISMLQQQGVNAGPYGQPSQPNNYGGGSGGGYNSNFGSNRPLPPTGPQQGQGSNNNNNNNNPYGQQPPPTGPGSSFYDQLSRRANR